jgi:CBS domain-containing protein
MKAADVMTQRVVTIDVDAPIANAMRLMIENRISGLPVVDATGRLAGIVTEGDFLRRTETGTEVRRPRWLQFLLSPGRLAEEYVRTHARKVGEVMTPDVATATEGTPVDEIVHLMERRRVKRVPVLRDDRLVGIVSRADLVRALAGVMTEAPPATVDDTALRDRVLAELEKQSWAPRVGVNVMVRNGVVDLWGAITDERERQALCVACENVIGVKTVRDHLCWVEPMSAWLIEPPEPEGDAAAR